MAEHKQRKTLSVMTLHQVFRFFLMLLFANSYAQNEMDWMQDWTNFNPIETEYPEVQKKMFNVISTDSYLPNDAVYLMSGTVYVTNGATLTIQEGTIIRCDPTVPTSLIITKGASLIAEGQPDLPIVFTSNQPPRSRKSGEWGGIVIAGSGNVSLPSSTGIVQGDFLKEYATYGGNETVKNTISLRYTRIEFAGKKINKKNQYNGLSLYAQDASATINHIMISYSGDDSFQFYGGSAELQNLISYKAKDDDYDMSLGYSGKLQSIVAVRHPLLSDVSGSYTIEIDGNEQHEESQLYNDLTPVIISDASLISLSNAKNYIYTSAAVSCNNNARIEIRDSRISGFANVVKFDTSYDTYKDLKGSFALENSICNIHGSQLTATISLDESEQELLKYNMFTTVFKDVNEFFQSPLNKEKPQFTLRKPKTNYTVN